MTKRDDKIAELETKMLELQKQLEELKAMPEEKRWKPKEAEEYWFVGNYFNVGSFYWSNDEGDYFLYSHSNCFKTQEEAEERAKQLKMQTEYKVWCEEHSDFIDWQDETQYKYFACYHTDIHNDKRLGFVSFITTKFQGVTYATSKEIIQDFVDKVGEEDFIKYVLEVKG